MGDGGSFVWVGGWVGSECKVLGIGDGGRRCLGMMGVCRRRVDMRMDSRDPGVRPWVAAIAAWWVGVGTVMGKPGVSRAVTELERARAVSVLDVPAVRSPAALGGRTRMLVSERRERAELPVVLVSRGEDRGSLVMTDQVPSFTLPSQEERIAREQIAEDDDGGFLGIVREVAPVALLTGGAVLGVMKVRSNLEERRLKTFQRKLQNISGEAKPEASSDEAKDQATVSPRRAVTESRRFEFRTGKGGTRLSQDEIRAKAQLDILKGVPSSSAVETEVVPSGGDLDAATEEALNMASEALQMPELPVKPVNAFESAVVACIEGADVESLKTVAADSFPNRQVASSAFAQFASAQVSGLLDRMASMVESDDREALANLAMLVAVTSRFRQVGEGAFDEPPVLSYNGSSLKNDQVKEDVYKRYALYCLSTQDRIKSDFSGLREMQQMLDVSDQKAESINNEVAKAMFQVAVSTAMADGKNISSKAKQLLEQLQNDFSEILDKDTSDSIMSEVGVMRVMYSLQQLIEEQGVTEDDVKELRKMCVGLGVDIDEMLKNADAMGNALGPEAKEFVESIRTLLSDDPKTNPPPSNS
mmetsp:Transcript_17988/g.37318  ORF Transcript_17988/g.37318 Transcript_17988/m.37318 type:complete len:588 (-) Transcript_17988:2407-4170(-)